MLGGSTVALAVLVAEFLLSRRMREIADHSLLAAQERERQHAELAEELEMRREEAEEALELERGKRMDKWDLQFMASFQQDLRWIDLSGHDLSGLYLQGCKLLRANLKGTNLNGANLNGATWRGPTSTKQRWRARILATPTLPARVWREPSSRGQTLLGQI